VTPDVSPSLGALEKAAEIAGPLATVDTVRPLPGGTHARTYLIQTENPALDMVLREFPVGDEAGSREVRVLRALHGLDGLAPRLLASDLDGGWSTHPSVLISRLAGHADITPNDSTEWATQLGRALARVHATPTNHLAALDRVLDRPGGTLEGIIGPAAATVDTNWARLVRQPIVLTHSDFWSGNVLWDDGALSGVVDWSGGALGPAGFDLGWCRLDLVLLYDQSVADVFLAAYEAAIGSVVSDPQLCDLWAVARAHDIVETWVPNYRDLGRVDLTAPELRRRHTAWTRRLLAHR
jgi:aminoglycoside phosphotransferase (APT) family kinase protein